MGTLNDYNANRRKNLIGNLVANNSRYTIETQGRSEKIIYQGFEHNFPYIGHTPGFHLIRTLKRNLLAKFKVNNPDYDYNIKPNWQICDFNVPVIKENLNTIVAAIDITDCYWFTMYFLGYMDKNMFIEGLQKDEWKESRNMAIGALSTVKKTYEYEGSKLIEESVTEEDLVEGGRGICTHIKNHVWAVFSELIDFIGRDHYLMYYVDCIWVDSSVYNQARQFLNDKGYIVKETDYEFIEVDDTENLITAINITDEITRKRDKYRKYYFK